jgi:hypothetical protein
MAGRTGSSSQAGKAAELAAACALMTTTSGRLSPFVPLVDDHGLDLLILDKLTNAVAGVQVKSWVWDATAARSTVQFDIRKATYRATPNWFLLAAVVDAATALLSPVWLVPMTLAPSLSIDKPEKYALCPSTSPSSSDRYTPFRYADMRAVSWSLIEQLNGSASASPLP